MSSPITGEVACSRLSPHITYGTISLRAQNRKELNDKINIWTERFSKKELINLLGGKVPFGPVNNVREIFEDKHVKKRDMIFQGLIQLILFFYIRTGLSMM